MSSDSTDLHILLFPVMAQGHLLPMIDMANLFATHGVKTTILTTPANAPIVQPSINRANLSDHRHPIRLAFIPFPSSTGLPDACENLSAVPPPLIPNFFAALDLLKQPFSDTLRHLRPHCVITGMFFPWTVDVASELGIPRIVFHGSSFFSRCAIDCIERQVDVANLQSGARTLVLPGLPHRIEMLVSQVPDYRSAVPYLADLLTRMAESELRSYGVVFNSFYELEPDYADHFRTVMARRAWHIGPMLLCSGAAADMSSRGSAAGLDHNECLSWLDQQKPGTVLYACFGSASEFSTAQLRRIALGLEESGHPFVWGAREVSDEAIPEGFEERVKGRGMVIRGWAPQVMILNHAAVGGFLTHCGWNSTLEAVCAGLPLVTWPLFADQFYNERLIVDVLGIGVAVGSTQYSIRADGRPLIEPDVIGGAVDKLMGGGEVAEERRRKAKELGVLARKAVESGGSSQVDVGYLIQELNKLRNEEL